MFPNDQADFNLLLSEKTWTGQESELSKLDDQFTEEKLDGIFCVAGGWAGGNASSEGINFLFSYRLNMYDHVLCRGILFCQYGSR